ncbi:MAG TPA: AAA family ATPase, partial [Steroidobacteraceae bacterium]|nr:AAA family ATPase [Steroidobacteraceae bacterium]
SDVERKRLAGLQALETSRSGLDAGIYTAEFNSRTYERMLDCARSALTAGETVIVDAAFLRRAERNQFRSLASEYNASFKILHCDAPESVLRERISVRLKSGTDASEATLDVLSKQHGYWEPFAEDELAYTLRIDTTQPTSELKRFVC